MKKTIYSTLAAFAALTLFSACTANEGVEPGNDPVAVTTLYVYNADLPNDPDCDAVARVATNSATDEVYILVESEDNYKAHCTGEDAYTDYVLANGKLVDGASKGAVADVLLPGLKGHYYISVVSKGANPDCCTGKSGNLATLDFTGQTWNDICTGTYYFAVANIQAVMGTDHVSATLQQNGDDLKQYRIKNVYAPGFHLIFNLDGRHYKDGSAVVRVPSQATPFSHSTYGTLSVRDVAEWQGDEGYLDCALYDDNYCYFWVQYYAGKANFGNGYDEFVPD